MQIDQPKEITEISFENVLTSIREGEVFPMPQTGLDGYETVRLHQARNPRYLARYNEKQVIREIKNGADVVVCTQLSRRLQGSDLPPRFLQQGFNLGLNHRQVPKKLLAC